MSTTILIILCIGGVIMVTALLRLAQMITPVVLGGLTIVVGIYQGVQIGGQGGWIIGISCVVGGAIFLLLCIVGERDEESESAPSPEELPPPKKEGPSVEGPEPTKEGRLAAAGAEEEQEAQDPRLELQRVKVSVSRRGKLIETNSGRLHLDGSRLYLKKLFGKEDLFKLSAVEALEHRGKRLTARLPGTFFVVEFVHREKEEVLRYKRAFSTLTGLPISGDPNKFHIEKSHLVTAGAVLLVLVLSLSGGVKRFGCNPDVPGQSSNGKNLEEVNTGP